METFETGMVQAPDPGLRPPTILDRLLETEARLQKVNERIDELAKRIDELGQRVFDRLERLESIVGS